MRSGSVRRVPPAKKSRRSKRPRHEDPARQILDAADALFCERGYAAVSMRDVAEQAGVNKALIFYYYETKSDLFAAVLNRYYDAHAGVLANLGGDDDGGGPRERMRRFLDAYLDFLDENRQYTRLVQQEVARSGEHLPLIRKNLAVLYQRTDKVVGDLLPAEGPLSAKHFFLTLSGMTINFYTYAEVLRPIWGGSLMSAAARAERREHTHWVLESLLARIPGIE